MERKKEYNVSVYSNLEESLFASFLRVPKRVLRDVVLDLKQVLRYIMLTGKSLSHTNYLKPCDKDMDWLLVSLVLSLYLCTVGLQSIEVL